MFGGGGSCPVEAVLSICTRAELPEVPEVGGGMSYKLSDQIQQGQKGLSLLLGTCQTTNGSCIQVLIHKSRWKLAKQDKIRESHHESAGGALPLMGGAMAPGPIHSGAETAVRHLKAP